MNPSKVQLFFTQHALAAFFVLAFIFTFSVWLFFPALNSNDDLTVTLLVALGSFGPALSAVILGAATGEKKIRMGWSQRKVFMGALVLAMGTMLLILMEIPKGERSPTLWVVGGLCALLAAFTLAVNIPEGKKFTEWWFPKGERRFSPLWYLGALLILPRINAIGLAITALLGMPMPAMPVFKDVKDLALLLGVNLLVILFYGGPFGEEPGWRGFALPRLQARFSPLVASLILGLLWALWRTPLHINDLTSGNAAGVLLHLAANIPMAVLFTWFYNRTNGSLPASMVLHTGVNATTIFLPQTAVATIISFAALVVIVVTARMWRKRTTPKLAVEARSLDV
jgi:membrane protease YdiL (CAAX protease family)